MIPGIANRLCSSLLAVAPRDETDYVYQFDALPEGWWAAAGFALATGLIVAVVWMYRREGRVGASMRIRMALAAARCALILLLIAIWLEPVRVRRLTRWIDSYTLVLVDDSSSMDLADVYRDPEHAERVKSLLSVDELSPVRRRSLVERILGDDDNRFLTDLAKRNRVKLYTFDEEPRLEATIRAAREQIPKASTERAEGSPLGPAELDVRFAARGGATNIGRAVRRSVESLGSAPLAAVVLLTDGGINQGDGVEAIAAYARDHNVPIHVIGVGDPSPPRNIRVAELIAPDHVLKADPFAITVRLTSMGATGRSFDVVLRRSEAGSSGVGRVVETRRVTVDGDGLISPMTFAQTARGVGHYVYTAEVPVQPWESVADDNRKQAGVTVIESKYRVLLISGGPSWEYQFLSRLLTRDATFELSCWLQSADVRAVRDGNRIIDHLPVLAEELFDYDLIILMDPDPQELTESWCRLVDTLVSEYGGGLLFAAARPNTPAFVRDPAMRPLLNLLPVRFDPSVDLLLNQIGHYQRKAWSILLPDRVYTHPVVQLGDDPVATKLAWQQIGDVYWHYPVLREKPVATVLLRHGDPRMQNDFGPNILAAVQYVGAGRTGFVGFDGTWRWRKYGEAVFDRFWVQMARHLVQGKRLGGTRRAMLTTEGDQFSLGDVVTVSARLLTERFEPLAVEEVIAGFEVEGRTGTFALSAARDNPGWFEGRFVPDRVGSYRLSLAISSSSEKVTEVTREISVARPNVEIIRPQMEETALRRLAEDSFGGRYFRVDEANQVPELIPDVSEKTTIRSRPTMLWDNGYVLALLVMLVGGEWALRKMNRLL